MTDTTKFLRIESWQSALGLLYVPLRESVEHYQRYVLLNGLTGNFCLDFDPAADPVTRRAAAWSSDVGHYVAVKNEIVTIHRWDRQAAVDRYSWSSIVERIRDFHRYLEKDDPDRSKSVVNHVLRVFRMIRAALQEGEEATASLEILLCMLACGASGSDRAGLDVAQWGLSSQAVDRASELPVATWESLYSDLTGSGRYEVLRPDFELVVRHAAGTLFQEAHIEAHISPNLWLPGFEGPVRAAVGARPETGVYFTPPAIARTLAEEAVRAIWNATAPSITIFDPACGSGELLRDCLRLLKLRGYSGRVTVIGFDSSATSIAMARFALASDKRHWPPNQIDISLQQQNSLTATWPTAVNILIMNPPFQSWQQMDSDTRRAVVDVLGEQLKNKPNLAMAFALRAVAVMAEDAVLAMVAPSSLLEASSGKRVRDALAGRLKPILVAKFGYQRAFAHALVDAGMYVGSTREPPYNGAAVLWADPQPGSLSRALRGLRRWRGAETEPLKEEGFAVYLRKGLGISGSPWVARGFDAWQSYEATRRSRKTISAHKLFDIRQGVRLGSDVFIVSKEHVASLPRAERSFFRPAVMNPSIRDGRLDDSYYVFYPYSDGLPEVRTEDDLASHVRTYYTSTLLPAKEKLASRKSLEREQLNWWDLIWPRSWQQGKLPKIVSKYFGGEKSFAFDRNGDFVVVVGHAWLLQEASTESNLTAEEVQFATLAYLNSSVALALMEYSSVQVSGGQFDLSNKYVKDLPILNFAKLEVPLVGELVRMGRAIADGTIERWADVDDLVFSALEV
jgi:hypothetical protein